MKLVIYLLLIAVAWLTGAWLLTLVVGLVHDWWPLVPPMPYTTALAVKGVILAGVVASATLKAIWKVVQDA